MRTTVDLPDELFRRVKSTAALRGMKLKDLIITALESDVGCASGTREGVVAVNRDGPPLMIPGTEFVIRSLKNDEIFEMLEQDRDEFYG